MGWFDQRGWRPNPTKARRSRKPKPVAPVRTPELTLKEFARKVHNGMVRIREGYEGHGEGCRCHVCEGARIVKTAFDELESAGQWNSLPKIEGYEILGRLGHQ